MGIFHAFVDAGLEDPNPDIVRPRDWNADHSSPYQNVITWGEWTNPGDSWFNMPAALTIMFGDQRSHTIADLRYASVARLMLDIMTPGASGAEFRAQYSTDFATWAYLDGVSGPAAPLAAAGMITTAWADIAAAAKIENCYLRIVGINGNAVADPKLRSVVLQVR